MLARRRASSGPFDNRLGVTIALAGVTLAFPTFLMRTYETGDYMLHLTEYRPWNSEPNQLQQLVVKAGNYIKFIKNGELVKHSPDAQGKPVSIVIGYYDDPTPQAGAVLDQLVPQIEGHGIGVRLVKYDPRERPTSY